MRWVKISERLPEKDGWYLWWDGHYYSDRYYIVGKSYGRHYTHWLEITGPEVCVWERFGEFYFSPHNTMDRFSDECFKFCPYCGKIIKVKE